MTSCLKIQLDDIRKRMEALAEEKNLINTFIRKQAQIEKLNDPDVPDN